MRPVIQMILFGNNSVAFPWKIGSKFVMKRAFGGVVIKLYKDYIEARMMFIPWRILDVPIKSIRKVEVDSQFNKFKEATRFVRLTYIRNKQIKQVLLFLGVSSDKWAQEINKLINHL